MSSVDKREAYARAQRAMQSNRPAEAISPLWSLIDRSHLVDEEFAGYLRMLAQAFAQIGNNRAAATIYLFLGDGSKAWNLCKDSPRDRARCQIAAGRSREAAQSFERLLVHLDLGPGLHGCRQASQIHLEP